MAGEFKGHWDHIKEVTEDSQGYHNEFYWFIRKSKIVEYIDKNNSHVFPLTTIGSSGLMPLLVSVLPQKKINILDFGGGLGRCYLNLLCSCPNKIEDVEYHVFDLKEAKEAGLEVFSGVPSLFFHSEMPQGIKFDVIYADASFHYVKDYKKAINEITEYGAEYILFVNLSIGKFLTHAKQQINFDYATFGMWCFNYNEFIELFAALGYSLVFSGTFEGEVETIECPEELKLKHTANLLFKKMECSSHG